MSTDAEFLREAAKYFERQDTGGEDLAFWANTYNAERCRQIAGRLDEPSTPAARFSRLYGICRRLRWKDYGVPSLESDGSRQALEDLTEFLFMDGIDRALSEQPAVLRQSKEPVEAP